LVYRRFDAQTVNDLYFIKGARDLGFSVEKIAELLTLARQDAA
jgi:DNA-binding transcriptional MerR regulator